MNGRNSAERADTVLPEPFKGIAEDLEFPLPWGVRGNE